MTAHTIDYIAIGRRVRTSRLSRQYTQERLAELADISTSFVGHIERGEKAASMETMARLSDILDVSMDYLVLGRKQKCQKMGCRLFSELTALMEGYR